MSKKLIFDFNPNLKSVIIFVIIMMNVYCNRRISLSVINIRPDMKVENLISINYQNGKIMWEIQAKESCYYFDEKRSIAKTIVMNYYNDNKKAALIEADKAIIHTDSKNIELIGNVDLLSTSGNRLLTPKIRWDHHTKLLDTDEKIKILRKNGDIIEGIGLKANYDLEDYEIKRDVIAITKTSDKNIKRTSQR